jgi:glycosyltransferase involved in cell wall biosynthesis
MKVALVSPIPMFPTIAGHASRIRRLAAAIQASGHELTFFHLPSRLNLQVPDDAAHEAMLGKGHYVRLHNGNLFERFMHAAREWPLRRWQKLQRMLGRDAGGYSLLDQVYRRCWSRQLARFSQGVDVVMVEYAFVSRAFEAFPQARLRLLDTHDSFVDRHLRYARKGLKRGFWFSLRAREENRGLRRAHTVLAIQEEEAQLFTQQLGRDGVAANPDIAVVSHVLDLDHPVTDYSCGNSAVFVGSNSGPNRYSLGIFLAQVLPLIVREIPDFQLLVVGRICDWLPDTPHVARLGFVGDMKSVLNRAPLSLNPVMLGSGINIKLLEAMAAAVPTISTHTGVRGLPGSFGSGVVVVPDADHARHAAEIVRFARSASLRRETGQAAFRDAQRWNATQHEALQRVLGG